MPPRTKTAPPKRGRKLTRSKESATKGSAPPIGTRGYFECPLCGRTDANATFTTTRRHLNVPDWCISCWSCEGDDYLYLGNDYLCAVAEAFGLDPYATTKDQIATAIMEANGRGVSRRAEAEPLPSPSSLAGWAARLLASRGPLDYLTETRGLSLDVIEEARIGFDRDRGRLVFPMYRGGELVAAKWRKPRDGGQMRSWAGERAWPLYPEPEPGWRRVLLVAGELDALRGRSVGLPAASVTPGAGVWRDEWAETLRGRRVVVCFDNGEQEQARQRVAALKQAGVRARRLDLRSLGLDTPKSDLSDWLNGGGSPDRLRAAARRAS